MSYAATCGDWACIRSRMRNATCWARLERSAMRWRRSPARTALMLPHSKKSSQAPTRPPTKHRRAILGPSPEGRHVSIMVTLPTEAADNEELVAEMIAAGMNVARINCAHDDADAWERMIANVRAKANEAGTECRVIMDLAGPKLRTGELTPGPRVIHIRPKRDAMGRVVAPRRIRLIPEDALQRGTKNCRRTCSRRMYRTCPRRRRNAVSRHARQEAPASSCRKR